MDDLAFFLFFATGLIKMLLQKGPEFALFIKLKDGKPNRNCYIIVQVTVKRHLFLSGTV